jgi:tRNA (Thr-GGU) A37 N-methylase
MRSSDSEAPYTLAVVAHVRSDFPTKFGLPRQSGLIDELSARIVFTPEYRNPAALRGWKALPTCGSCGGFRAPGARGGRPRWSAAAGRQPQDGVFATRSPYGPTPWAFPACASSHRPRQPAGAGDPYRGADMKDGTPYSISSPICLTGLPA